VLAPGELPGGADSGLLLHDLLEQVDLAALRITGASVEDWQADPVVSQLIADRARERGIAEVYLPHAARIVHRTLTAPLALTDGNTLPSLVAAEQLAREVEFTYPVPGMTPPRALVKGFIDALVVYDDELWVLDYKSDLLAGSDPLAAARAHVDQHYLVQARLYALAAERLRGTRRLAGLLYAFIRYDVVVPLRVDDAMLGEWTTWLTNLRTEAVR
jgi:ATP-dependent exoDNAse (exonuclease V) beta subunit